MNRLTDEAVLRFLLRQLEELASAVQAQDEKTPDRAAAVERKCAELLHAIKLLE